METLLLPIASSSDLPEGFPAQDAPQGFGNFAKVLAKQYFKEGNPPSEDHKSSLGDPASSTTANDILPAILVPNGVAFPPEKPISDQGFAAFSEKEGFTAPSQMAISPLLIFSQPSLGSEPGAIAASMKMGNPVPLPGDKLSPSASPNQEKGAFSPPVSSLSKKEGFTAPSQMAISPLFIFSKSSLGSELEAIAASMNGGNPVPLPNEMPSLSVPPDQDKGAFAPPVSSHPANGETNQEMSPSGDKSPENPVPAIYSFISSISSGVQEAGPTLQESPIPLDSSISQTSLEEPLQRPLAGNLEMALEKGRKTAHPVDPSTPAISLEEVLLKESTGKKDMPTESGKKIVPFSDSPNTPVSLEEVLLRESTGKMDMPADSGKKIVPFSDSPIAPVSWEESLRKESAEKMELSAGGEKNFIRPLIQEESNGSERRPVQESKDFFPSFEPFLKMEANPRTGEGQVLKKQGPLFGAAKEAAGPEIPQNLQERCPLVGNQAYILDSPDKESGTPFSADAGKGQEKFLWVGPDIRPLAAREVQNPPSFLAALTDPLNRHVEYAGEIKEAPPPPSERPDPQAVFQQVGQRVLWLVRNNEERIRITLEPPELGQVFLEIDRHKEHIKTTLWTDNPTTKANLETSQGEIQRIIESEGFKLEKFDVFVQQDPGWFQGRKEDTGNPNSWKARMPVEEKASSANSMESIPGRTPAPDLASRYLDLLV